MPLASSPAFEDTFTEASDVALESHTPDTDDPGTGWSQANGNIRVESDTNRAIADNTGSGNRYNTGDLGQDHYDVEGDFRGDSGTFIFFGPKGRASGPTATDGLEFNYDHNAGGGSWNLDGEQLVEAWPGDPTTMRIEIRDGIARGYAGGVEKLSTTSDENADTGVHAGITLGNFDGNASLSPECDNFSVTLFETEWDDAEAAPEGALLATGNDVHNSDGSTHAESTDDGATWDAADTIPGTNFQAQYGGMAVTGDTVHILLPQSDPGGTSVEHEHRVSTDGGANWSSPTTLLESDGVTAALLRRVQIVVNGSVVHVVGLEKEDGSGGNTWYFRSTDGGSTWEDGVAVGINECQSIAVDETTGNVYILGHDLQDEGPVKVVRSTDDGATFGTPTTLSGTTNGARPRIVADQGRVVAMWQNQDDPSSPGEDIDGAFSDDDGATWGSPFTIMDASAVGIEKFNHFDAWMVGSVAHVAAASEITSFGDIYYAYSTDYGQTWSTPEVAIFLGNNPVWNLRADANWVHLTTESPEYTRRVAPAAAGGTTDGEVTETGSVDAKVAGEVSDVGSVDAALAGEITEDASVRAALAGEISESASVRAALVGEVQETGSVDSALAGEVSDVGSVEVALAGEVSEVGSVNVATSSTPGEVTETGTVDALVSGEVTEDASVRTVLVGEVQETASVRAALQGQVSEVASVDSAQSGEIVATGSVNVAVAVEAAFEGIGSSTGETIPTVETPGEVSEVGSVRALVAGEVSEVGSVRATVLSEITEDASVRAALVGEVSEPASVRVTLAGEVTETGSVNVQGGSVPGEVTEDGSVRALVPGEITEQGSVDSALAGETSEPASVQVALSGEVSEVGSVLGAIVGEVSEDASVRAALAGEQSVPGSVSASPSSEVAATGSANAEVSGQVVATGSVNVGGVDLGVATPNVHRPSWSRSHRATNPRTHRATED